MLDTSFLVSHLHSPELLIKPFSSLLPSLSYLDPLDDFCFCLFCFHGLLLSVFLICQWKGEGGRGSDGSRDGVREGEGRERREGERGREEGGRGETERERETEWERELCNVYQPCVLYLDLVRLSPAFCYMSLFFSFFLVFFRMVLTERVCALSLL